MQIDPQALAFEIATVMEARYRERRAAGGGARRRGYYLPDDFENDVEALSALTIDGADDLVAVVAEALQRLEATAAGAAG